MTTGWLWNERYAWYDTGAAAGFISGPDMQPHTHVESSDTKTRFASIVQVSGLGKQLTDIEPIAATEEDIARVHTARHINEMKTQSIDPRGGDAGDTFSPFAQGGFELALLAAGGTISAVKAVVEGSVDNAYALVRPPGHHAEPDTGMGFCMFSNIPVAIQYARHHLGVKRVAVVDWDVHHGNGTEACFMSDPNVLTISLHQDRNFPPDKGFVEHQGTGVGFGASINIPLPSGTGIGGYQYAMDKVVLPALERFKPELIIVASGFDASMVDPLGRMMLLSEDYAVLTKQVMQAADNLCGGKLVFNHEGGYSAFYVPFCGLAVIEALSGLDSTIQDPYMAAWGDMPGRILTQDQTNLVERVASQLDDVPSN